MFENYKTMTAEEKSAVKAIHVAARGTKGARNCGDRYYNLAWGFLRGFPFRRIERTHRMEGSFEHNLPSSYALTKLLLGMLAGAPAGTPAFTEATIHAWLDDPEGAIEAPIRVKKPYVRAIEGAA